MNLREIIIVGPNALLALMIDLIHLYWRGKLRNITMAPRLSRDPFPGELQLYLLMSRFGKAHE